jgi:hypothetical protein
LSGDELADRIISRLWGIGVDSENRAEEMLRLTMIVEDPVFWKVFHTCWSDCDDTWPLRNRLLEMLSFRDSNDPACFFMQPDQMSFYDSLPEIVEVYRRCSGRRVTVCLGPRT